MKASLYLNFGTINPNFRFNFVFELPFAHVCGYLFSKREKSPEFTIFRNKIFTALVFPTAKFEFSIRFIGGGGGTKVNRKYFCSIERSVILNSFEVLLIIVGIYQPQISASPQISPFFKKF